MEVLEYYEEQIKEEMKDNKVYSLNIALEKIIAYKQNNNMCNIDKLDDFLIRIYMYSCSNGKTYVLQNLLRDITIRNSLPREAILTGISLCLHIKEIMYFSNFIYLIDIFNVSKKEINGEHFNLMQFCVISDNVDALTFIINKFDCDFDTMDEFQKDILIMSALHNMSRKTIAYLHETKRITSQYLNKFPSDIIKNSVFLNELSKKYNYKNIGNKVTNVQKYVLPIFRNYSSKKTSYHIFNSRDINRADNDLNWRQTNQIIIKS